MWVQCQHGWCPLEAVDLSDVHDFGVYVIWHDGDLFLPPRTVRIGSGNIVERLTCHRTDPEVQHYARLAPLYVTWATVSAVLVDSVERYLAEMLRPLVGSRYPNALPTAVNLPW